MAIDNAKAIELGKLRRYVKAGKHHKRPFTSDVLTPLEISTVVQQVGGMKAANVSGAADAYGDEIAAVIERALDHKINRLGFEGEMRRLVKRRLTDAFKSGAGIEDDGDLIPEMTSAINEEVATHYASIANMSQEIYAVID